VRARGADSVERCPEYCSDISRTATVLSYLSGRVLDAPRERLILILFSSIQILNRRCVASLV
jgi:hypothetical protein